MNIPQLKNKKIEQICKSNQVKSLFAFGSVLRNDFNENSDIDLIVDFEEKDPFKYTDLYFSLKNSLENALKRQIDLIEERGIKNRFFKQELDATKVLIYGS